MVDWLVVWGVANTFGFAFKGVLVKLATEGLEEYVKDFFKDSIKEVVSLAETKPLKVAFGRAQAKFLLIFQEELEAVELADEEIADYQEILSEFICKQLVLETLGKPVEQKLGISSDDNNFDIKILANTWISLSSSSNYKALPNNFGWQRVATRYLRIIKHLVANHEELRELLNAENLQQTRDSLERQAPILPGFDLRTYRLPQWIIEQKSSYCQEKVIINYSLSIIK